MAVGNIKWSEGFFKQTAGKLIAVWWTERVREKVFSLSIHDDLSFILSLRHPDFQHLTRESKKRFL